MYPNVSNKRPLHISGPGRLFMGVVQIRVDVYSSRCKRKGWLHVTICDQRDANFLLSIITISISKSEWKVCCYVRLNICEKRLAVNVPLDLDLFIVYTCNRQRGQTATVATYKNCKKNKKKLNQINTCCTAQLQFDIIHLLLRKLNTARTTITYNINTYLQLIKERRSSKWYVSLCSLKIRRQQRVVRYFTPL